LLSGPFASPVSGRGAVSRWNTAVNRMDRVFESHLMGNFLGFAVRKLILLVIC